MDRTSYLDGMFETRRIARSYSVRDAVAYALRRAANVNGDRYPLTRDYARGALDAALAAVQGE